MKYKLTAAKFLRHLAVSYAQLKRKNNLGEIRHYAHNGKRLSIMEIQEMRGKIEALEKIHAGMLLSNEFDNKKMMGIAEKIQLLKEKMSKYPLP